MNEANFGSLIFMKLLYVIGGKGNYRQSDQVFDWKLKISAAHDHSGGRFCILKFFKSPSNRAYET